MFFIMKFTLVSANTKKAHALQRERAAICRQIRMDFIKRIEDESEEYWQRIVEEDRFMFSAFLTIAGIISTIIAIVASM